jgi:hypothetical protein
MSGWFVFMVYVGGALIETDKPLGFWNRLFWPAGLGIALMRWSLEQAEESK